MADDPAQSESIQDGQSTTSAATSGAGDEPKQITMTSQQLADRLARAKPADYDELKAKAEKFDQLKSEIEKATEGRTKTEQERDAARAEALRFKVAAAHGISTAPADDGGPSDAELFLTASDEATLTKQAERLLGRVADRKKTGNYVPREGANPSAAESDDAAFVRQLFSGD